MEVRAGYKQTEVGAIPDEWDAVPLGNHFQFKNGLNKAKEFFGFGTPIVNYMDVFQRPALKAEQIQGRVNVNARELKAYEVQQGDVFFTRTSETVEEIGIAAVMLEGLSDTVFSGFVLRARPTDRSLDTLFKGYCFSASYFRQQVTSRASYTTRALTNGRSLSVALIARPPLLEQRAIAAALSDVDALLGGLDRLIAKKRDLKQAAMQQLLTGQTRLPGFSGAWEMKRLGDVGEISSAGVDKKLSPDEVPVRLVNFLDVYRRDFIYSNDLNHWVTAPPHQAKRCAVQKGDVFFTPTSETRDDIGLSAVAMEDIPDAAYSYHVARLRLQEPWDLRFRTYAFKTRAFLDQAEILCDGNGTRYVISQGKFRSMTVLVPPVPEQAAIATVLSHMDIELSALVAQRDKTCDLKQAMMQELLTGRTRLV